MSLRGWASPAQLNQAAQDYRAAIAKIDEQGWCKVISDGERDGGPICAARAIGIVVGMDEQWNGFAGRASIALSACYRVTGLWLHQVNDKCTNWPDMRGIMLGIAEECEKAALVTGTMA